jgi:hypothetical protein
MLVSCIFVVLEDGFTVVWGLSSSPWILFLGGLLLSVSLNVPSPWNLSHDYIRHVCSFCNLSHGGTTLVRSPWDLSRNGITRHRSLETLSRGDIVRVCSSWNLSGGISRMIRRCRGTCSVGNLSQAGITHGGKQS